MKCSFSAISLGGTLLVAGCAPSPLPKPLPPAGQVAKNAACDPQHVLKLRHARKDHLNGNKNRLEYVYWQLTEAGNGALLNEPVTSGDILEWHCNPVVNRTSFCIAVPESGPIAWDICDTGPQWERNLGCKFPPGYKAVNAWQDDGIGDYVVRLRVTVTTPETRCPILYKIVVPPFEREPDPHAQQRGLAAPYDYYMVDATLDVSQVIPNQK